MISKRQEKILKVIVQEYTKTAQPVGSKRIVQLMNLGLSTATIRNESAALESLGYLEKQYTSSGRVPSSKGYRHYVDYLMDGQADQLVFDKIEELFADRTKSIDVIINESTKIISELTNLIAIVSKKDLQEELKIKRIELIMLSEHSASVLFILSNGEIIQKGYYLNQQDVNDLKISINLFNDNLIDTPIKDLVDKSGDLQKVIGQAVKDYDFLLAKLLKSLVEEMVIKKEVYGFKNVLINPEFADTKKIEQIWSVIEQISPFDWFNYSYQKAKNDLTIETKIGDEAQVFTGENDLSMMTTDFKLNEGQINAITLIGPKRMKYDQANVLLRFLIDKIHDFRK